MQKKLLAVVFLLAVPFFVTPGKTSAIYVAHKNSYISQNQTINDNVIIASDHVTIEGTINGNVYVAGGTVVVNGKVNGDVYVAGSKVEIGGFVRDNIVVAGGSVALDTALTNKGGIIFGTSKIK